MPHQAKVSHHVHGRIRVKVPAGKRNAAVLKDITESLNSVPGVRRIETNVLTGSIVVQYDHRAHAAFDESLAAHGVTTGIFRLEPPDVSDVDRLAADIEREAEFLAAHSDTARTIVDSVKKLNTGLKRATNNNLDLKVLLPLGLAAWAIIENDPEIATPLWLTLSIFSFNSFVALHAQPGAVTVDTRQIIREHADGSKVELRTRRKRSS